MIMRLTGISNEMAAKQWSRHTGQRTSYRSDGNPTRILPLNSGMKDYRESLAVAYIFFRKFRKTRLSLPKTKIKWLLQSVLIYVTAATIWSAHFGGEPLFLFPPLPRRSYVTPRAKSPANTCQNLALFTNFYSQITTFPSSTIPPFIIIPSNSTLPNHFQPPTVTSSTRFHAPYSNHVRHRRRHHQSRLLHLRDLVRYLL